MVICSHNDIIITKNNATCGLDVGANIIIYAIMANLNLYYNDNYQYLWNEEK